MTQEHIIKGFIARWFEQFDHLADAEVFLADLTPDVIWDVPDVDTSLHGHERFKAWYAGVLEILERPTEHHVSNIEIGEGSASLKVLFRARLKDGGRLEVQVQEHWCFELREDGQPLITHYVAIPLEEM